MICGSHSWQPHTGPDHCDKKPVPSAFKTAVATPLLKTHKLLTITGQSPFHVQTVRKDGCELTYCNSIQ